MAALPATNFEYGSLVDSEATLESSVVSPAQESLTESRIVDSTPGAQNIVKANTSKTDQVRSSMGVKLKIGLNVDSPAIVTPAIGQRNNSKIDGSVLDVTDKSVRCEFIAGGQTRIVWIPRSLFPDDVKVGFAFELLLTTVNGYRGPEVRPRTPVIDQRYEKEIEAALEQL